MNISEDQGTLLLKEDKDLFDDIYMRYWEKLFVVANKHLKNPEAAEDVVHDVFLSLWNNRKKLVILQLENYLVTAVKYQVLAQLKKKAYAQKYTKEVGMSATAGITPEISDKVHNRRILELVHKEIDQLPEKCKQIFQYSREDGMTSREIAAALKISKKTVDNQIQKAMDRIRLRLKQVLSSLFSF